MEIIKFEDFSNEGYSENDKGQLVSSDVIRKVGKELFNDNEQLFMSFLSADITKGKFIKKLRKIINNKYGNILLDSEVDEIINKYVKNYSPA